MKRHPHVVPRALRTSDTSEGCPFACCAINKVREQAEHIKLACEGKLTPALDYPLATMEQALRHSLELSFTARHHEDAPRALQLQVAPVVGAAPHGSTEAEGGATSDRGSDSSGRRDSQESQRLLARPRHGQCQRARGGRCAPRASSTPRHDVKRRRVATFRMTVVLGFIPCHAHVLSLPPVTMPNPSFCKVPRVWRHDSFVPCMAMKDTSEIAELIRCHLWPSCMRARPWSASGISTAQQRQHPHAVLLHTLC